MGLLSSRFRNALKTSRVAVNRRLLPQTFGGTKTIELGLINQAAVAFAPTISGGAQNLTIGLIDQTAVAHSPTVTSVAAIIVARIDQTAAPHAPTVTTTASIVVGQIDRTAVAHAPTVTQGEQLVDVGIITQTAAAFTPTVTSVAFIVLARIDQTAVAHQIEVIGPLTVQLPRINRPAAAFAPTVTNSTFEYIPPVSDPGSGTGAGAGSGATPVVPVITVGGVDISDDVRYVDAMFMSQANGVPGPCSFAVRDKEHTHGFTFGQEIVVSFAGQVYWRGFVKSVKRSYSTAVDDTTNPLTLARWFLIEGYDINWLLMRRVVRNKAQPAKGLLRPPSGYRDINHIDQWEIGAPSDVVLRWILSEYTDLEADGILLDRIDDIGSPNPDYAGSFSAAVTVTQLLQSVNRLLNGIFYIDPDRHFHFHSTEEANSPYTLTDRPTAPGHIGPTNFEVLTDATEMANDALVWGTAPGVSVVRFGRAQDTDKQAIHGRWQVGEFNTTMYKQASIDHRADAMINGNTASRFGAKEPKASATATVFTPAFKLGDVVTVRQEVFEATQYGPLGDDGEAAVVEVPLPVRRMTITFPTQNHPRFEMLLTQELDDPWSIYEFVFPRFPPFPPFPPFGPWPPPPDIPITDRPPEENPTGCSDTICGVTDSWERAVSQTSNSGSTITGQYAGASDAGPSWNVELQQGSSCEVDSDLILRSFRVSSSTGFGSSGLVLPWAEQAPAATVTYTTRFFPQGLTASIDGGDYDVVDLHFGASWLSALGPDVTIRINPSGAVLLGSRIAVSGGTATTIPDNWWTNAVDYYVTITYGPSGTVAEVTDGVTTYQASSSTVLESINDPYLSLIRIVNIVSGNHNDIQMSYGDLAITGVERCTAVQFDDFNRSVASGWGTASFGIPWHAQIFNDGTGSVDGSAGVIVADPFPATVAFETPAGANGPWMNTTGWTMLSRVRFDDLDSSIRFVIFGTGYSMELVVDPENARLQDQDADQASFSFAINQWYFVEWFLNWTDDASTKTWEGRIWAEGGTRPASPMVSGSGGTAYPDGTAKFSVQASNFDATTTTWLVDYIDFEYDGRPCYDDCADVLVDEFNRTVAKAIQPDLGLSDSGATWQFFAFDSTAVEMGGGYLRFYGPANGAEGSSADFRLTLGSFTTDNAVPPTTVLRSYEAKFRASYVHNVTNNFTELKFPIQCDYPLDIRVQISTVAGAGASGGRVRLNGIAVEKTDWVANTWYIARADVLADGAVGLKVYEADDPEPGSYDITTAAGEWPDGGGPMGDNELDIDVDIDALVGGTDVFGQTVDVEYIRINACDTVMPTIPSSGLPTSGPVCETIEHSGGTNFITTRPFLSGSAQVWVNGLRLMPSTDYDQNGVEGLVTLTSAISGSDTLRICYQANGVI